MISRLSAASGHPTPAEAIGCRTEVQRKADMDAGISIILFASPTAIARVFNDMQLGQRIREVA